MFDQWNDMLVDGLSTPVRSVRPRHSAGHGHQCTCNMGDIAVNQWQANLYTRTFFDENGDRRCHRRTMRTRTSPGADQHPVPRRQLLQLQQHRPERLRRLQRNLPAVQLVRGGNRFDPLQEHRDARGLRRGRAGGRNRSHGVPAQDHAELHDRQRTWRTRWRRFPFPTTLRFPGAVYCDNCGLHGLLSDSPMRPVPAAQPRTTNSPPAVSIRALGRTAMAGRASSGRTRSSNSARSPSPPERTAASRHVVYASTRPFDDPALLLQLSWEPQVPNVTINLYQEGTAPDGNQTLKLVDTTKTSSWDDWAQGFRSDGIPNMNCPGQDGSSTEPTCSSSHCATSASSWMVQPPHGGRR